MAFHQPTRQSLQRVVRPTAEERSAAQVDAPNAARQPDESQTWVLFSPATEASTTSYLSETERSLQTPGRSRVSDFASLETVARSEPNALSRHSSVIDDESVEDDAELDSLDSHLPEFRSVPGFYSQSPEDSQPVFPSHDGLGSFRLNEPILDAHAQDHIYQFERFNPRRVRQRQSFDLTQLEVEHEQVQETEKRQRIEAWRLEHSRMLLSEIQRETRRRRQSQASMQHVQSLNVTHGPRSQAESDNMTWHDEDAVGAPENHEGLITRITRKVIQDLMGIDDRMLSVLFGEEVPDEEDLSATPRASQLRQESVQSASSQPWQTHVLEKVSRELGILVNQLSHHPGAFSTYQNVQQMPIPYAGLPAIPESSSSPSRTSSISPLQPKQTTIPEFQPSMKPTAQPIDILGTSPGAVPGASQADLPMGNFTQDEWEQDLDIKLVFKYLRSRFSSRSNVSPSNGSSHLATSTSQDAAAKVARIRQHHPLVSRMRPTERRTFKATVPSSPVALRHPSSCASQSTRRSARRSSVSSRHYWDIGGSLGTGSMIGGNGPMGSWGEV